MLNLQDMYSEFLNAFPIHLETSTAHPSVHQAPWPRPLNARAVTATTTWKPPRKSGPWRFAGFDHLQT